MSGTRRAAQSLPVWTTFRVGYAMVMLLVERKKRRTGGPGIIPFELAGHSAAAAGDHGTMGRRRSSCSPRVIHTRFRLTKTLPGVCTGYLAEFGIVRTWTRRREPKRLNPRGAVA